MLGKFLSRPRSRGGSRAAPLHGPRMSVGDDRIQELNRRFLEFMTKPENVESASREIYEDLLEEVLMGFVFDAHRMLKTGSSDVEEGVQDEESYAIIDLPGLDVFGQHPIKKSQECTCPNCERGVAASRFATHLEKCMGMGRNSSRIASRRIANNSKDLTTFSGVISDDDDDVDWSIGNDKRKRRKDRNGLKKLKQAKISLSNIGILGSANSTAAGQHKNGSSDNSNEMIFTSSESCSPSNFENMSLDEKKALLQQICGVVSEHTKKLCTRSMRCPQHTDDQRKEMRANLDGSSGSQNNGNNGQDGNSLIDIDTFEETDSQSLRETLARWDREGSSHSSPADSASTTSTSSISRKSKSKGKGKNSKRDRSSPVTQLD